MKTPRNGFRIVFKNQRLLTSAFSKLEFMNNSKPIFKENIDENEFTTSLILITCIVYPYHKRLFEHHLWECVNSDYVSHNLIIVSHNLIIRTKCF